VDTRDGESHVGLLGQDVPDQITLVQAAGQRTTIPRKDVVRFESSGSSLMPEGLEAGRSPKDLRDLIAFIQAAR
jgi:putative heme-binding domain-containing protein